LEKGKVHPEEVVGVKKIYNKLEALNDEVRKGAEVCFSMLLGQIYTLPTTLLDPYL